MGSQPLCLCGDVGRIANGHVEVPHPLRLPEVLFQVKKVEETISI